jgi:hypothetical protein
MFNPITKISSLLATRAREAARLNYARERTDCGEDLSFTEAAHRFAARNDLYAYMHRYFFTHLPAPLREHRAYFAKQGRGFGEEAFHSMWYLLLREFRPAVALEIGVFRGQVISLWTLIARLIDLPLSVRCISPFSAAGDLVSRYAKLNYLQDMQQNFRRFDLPLPDYLQGLSTDSRAIEYLRREPLDLVYVDGGHDFEVVRSDYQNSVAALKPGGLLVMDDSSLYTDFVPPPFSFPGHPGPSRVARELADRELQHLGGVGHQNVYRRKP